MSTPVARAGAGLRLLRTAVFAAVCVALAASGHALASSTAVPSWTLLVGFAGVFASVAPLAGRERSLPSIAAALTAGQLALHTLFGAGTHGLFGLGSDSAVSADDAAQASRDDSLIQYAAHLVCGAGPAQLNAGDAHRIVTTAGLDPASVVPAGRPAAAMSGPAADLVPGLVPGLPMLLGHLLAALATGWLLRRGEVALFRLARLSAQGAQQFAAEARLRALRAALALVRALLAGLPDAPATGPRPLRTAEEALPAGADDPLKHSVIRRGPPSVLALAA
ncbi:hypothetical protein PZB75_14735 [Streptomyces sp. AM 4-1-1]|uniref:hypothetical protein n=1 Tax=unclassified Streptomyces TaxID=2593676 RepID=UPI0023B921C0|nr:hypothetical protein [Streptomyces sp. AM 4-1-1]WEH34490.1 hypothetical protein PZB75_14735 [Streptomyces sp. AM 4-1-1]